MSKIKQQIAALKRASNDNIIRLRCPFDPPVYKTDAIYTRVVQVNSPAAVKLSYQSIYNALGIGGSGTSNDFSLAVTSARIWGPAAADSHLQIDVWESTVSGNPTFARFEDYGTQGAKRPGISVQFPKLIREQWLANSVTGVDTTIINVVSTIPTVAHFNVRLRFNAVS